MEKRSASSVACPGRFDSEAPETMRIAELTKSANVKRDIPSSMIEYVRQDLMAERDGRYLGASSSSAFGRSCPSLR